MTHQFAAPNVARTPAGRHAPRAKMFQQPHQDQQPLRNLPATPRTGLALLGNDNSATVAVAKGPAVKPAQPPSAVEPTERPPPPPSAYEAPFEWEFLPDTADWLGLIGRLGGCGLPFGGNGGGGGVFGDIDDSNNKENVPPPPESPSPSSSPSSLSLDSGENCGDIHQQHHWQESPTRSRRRDDRDCVEICFDIGRIL